MEGLWALRMQLSGVSGQGVRRLQEPVRCDLTGAAVLSLEVPGGIISMRFGPGATCSAIISLVDVQSEEIAARVLSEHAQELPREEAAAPPKPEQDQAPEGPAEPSERPVEETAREPA